MQHKQPLWQKCGRCIWWREEGCVHQTGKCVSHWQSYQCLVPSGSFSIRPEKEPQYTNRGPVQFCSLIVKVDKINEEQLFASLSGTGLYQVSSAMTYAKLQWYDALKSDGHMWREKCSGLVLFVSVFLFILSSMKTSFSQNLSSSCASVLFCNKNDVMIIWR